MPYIYYTNYNILVKSLCSQEVNPNHLNQSRKSRSNTLYKSLMGGICLYYISEGVNGLNVC